MEVWLSILVTGVLTALAIYSTGRAIERGVEKAIKTIHDDIKHSQAKLERKIEKRRSRGI